MRVVGLALCRRRQVKWETRYRGYLIHVVKEHFAWSFSAQPQTPDLPILQRHKYALHVSREAALAEAIERIDKLLDNLDARGRKRPKPTTVGSTRPY